MNKRQRKKAKKKAVYKWWADELEKCKSIAYFYSKYVVIAKGTTNFTENEKQNMADTYYSQLAPILRNQ